MALKAHLQSLSQRHQELDHLLSNEMKHPHPDEIRLYELKRLKLKLKDQIERLRQDNHSPG